MFFSFILKKEYFSFGSFTEKDIENCEEKL